MPPSHQRFRKLNSGLVVASLFLCGCSSKQATSSPLDRAAALDRPPADFSLSVTVLAPVQAPASAFSPLPSDRRPARYLLEPGGTFRAALGPGLSHRAYPPVVRTLSRAQTVSLWQALRQTDLLRDDHPARVGLPPDPSPDGRGPLTYVMAFTIVGDHRTLALYPGSPADGDADEARRLVSQLAELAWVPE